jgi:hypothetical protein
MQRLSWWTMIVAVLLSSLFSGYASAQPRALTPTNLASGTSVLTSSSNFEETWWHYSGDQWSPNYWHCQSNRAISWSLTDGSILDGDWRCGARWINNDDNEQASVTLTIPLGRVHRISEIRIYANTQGVSQQASSLCTADSWTTPFGSSSTMTLGGATVMTGSSRVTDVTITLRKTRTSALTDTLCISEIEVYGYLAPTIDDAFTPATGRLGSVVTVRGVEFVGVQSVTIGGKPALFDVVNSSTLRVVVPETSGGAIAVRTRDGTGTTSTSFSVQDIAPGILSFSPSRGGPGALVTIRGVHLSGVSHVRIGGVNAKFSVQSPNAILALVPAGVRSGAISVVWRGTVVSSTGRFTATVSSSAPPNASSAPRITRMDPATALPGDIVTLEGSNFGGMLSVKVGNVGAMFTVLSATRLRFIVPSRATSGRIMAQNPFAPARSPSNLTVVTRGRPSIVDFTPSFGPAGTVLLVKGSGFGNTTFVRIGSTPQPFRVLSPSLLQILVSHGTDWGQIEVTTPGGVRRTTEEFGVT